MAHSEGKASLVWFGSVLSAKQRTGKLSESFSQTAAPRAGGPEHRSGAGRAAEPKKRGLCLLGSSLHLRPEQCKLQSPGERSSHSWGCCWDGRAGRESWGGCGAWGGCPRTRKHMPRPLEPFEHCPRKSHLVWPLLRLSLGLSHSMVCSGLVFWEGRGLGFSGLMCLSDCRKCPSPFKRKKEKQGKDL